MKIRVILHYFLFLTIIVGAFAAMAQNDYGLTIIAAACFFMAGILVVELIGGFRSKKLDKLVELSGLSILFVLFGLRALYIHFTFVEFVLLLSSAALIITYLMHLRENLVVVGGDNLIMKRLVILYYLGIIGFLISIILTLYVPVLGEPFGVISTLFIGLFALGVWRYKSLLVNGERVTTANYLSRSAGHSLILVTGFVLISIYAGLSMFNLLPTLYTSKLPHNYIELINQAEQGGEKPVDGTYKYQRYEEAYARFLKEHGTD
jgi:hypothetical protein